MAMSRQKPKEGMYKRCSAIGRPEIKIMFDAGKSVNKTHPMAKEKILARLYLIAKKTHRPVASIE